MAGEARRVRVRCGWAWCGMAGVARYGMVRSGQARYGAARQALKNISHN